MIEQPRIRTAEPVHLARDERSMRVVEYAMAFTAIVVALLISIN